ncbi:MULTISPECIES: glycosidase [unclassified Sphingomonas]|uniref:glycosidase n=1 Tax=unclassified Sphingomonas TaxID=196159 RepID=UPI00226AABEF|nr:MULTISPECIES: glycosidase [unclassified Sphingomonas]
MSVDFNAEAIEPVTLLGPPALLERDHMSPFVWAEPDGRLGIMVRAVPSATMARTDTGVIWAGWSQDGRTFQMDDAPCIVPGPEPVDIGGVEDPTVLRREDGSYAVLYTAVTADMAHGELSRAEGPDIHSLTKTGVALASSDSEGNTKEATLAQASDGSWRLFYEYAADEASRVGMATGAGVGEAWTEQTPPFQPRADSWDDWHLSTGPMLMSDPEMPVMFYNGATRDARWRIGWVAFDRDITKVVARGLQPLITPPPAADRGATDIAFAASAIVTDGTTWLYYSLEDRKLARASVRRS